MSDRKKSKWGVPTWYFMHTFAEKVNEDFYKKKASECFNMIKNICYNLPCPYCRTHAIAYLKNTKIINVNTKEKLKFFLWNFHNVVSKNSKKRAFDKSILKQYESVSILKAWIFFEKNFFLHYRVNRQFNNWQRKSAKEKIETFLRNNWNEMF